MDMAAEPNARPAHDEAGAGQSVDPGVAVYRPARVWPAETARGPIEVAEPPSLSEDPTGRLMALLPLLGAVSMIVFAFLIKSVVYLVVTGVMVVAMVGASLGTTISQRRGARRRSEHAKSRYREQLRAAVDQAHRTAAVQRAGLDGLFPNPASLATVFEPDGGLWERRPGDRDFAHVRLGVGAVATWRPVVTAGASHGLDDRPDPDLEAVLERTRTETEFLPAAPVTAPLPKLGTVAVVGPPERTRSLVGAWLASLAAFHAPGELRIAGWVPAEAGGSWDWLKWLPHSRDPQGGNGLGRADREVTTDLDRFGQTIENLSRTAANRGEHVIVVVDGWHPDAAVAGIDALSTVMERAATLGVTVIVLTGSAGEVPSTCGAE